MRQVLIVFLCLTLVACGGRKNNQTRKDTRTPNIPIAQTYVKYGDVDRYDWTGTRPWSYPIHGIDVSKFQGDIDWRTAKRGGINFAFIKATEGGDHLDENFHKNWHQSRRARVLRGAYHFYYFCRSATEQANWFIRTVPRDPKALPPVLDMEWNHQSKTCPYKPEASVIRNEMRIFLERLTNYYGKRPIIYSTPDFYKENQLWRVRGYQFWLRSVAGHPSETYPRHRWAFWQYTGTGLVPGIEGKVDLNAFAGSISQWKKWAGSVTR